MSQMSYLNCTRCGLSMACRHSTLEPAHCPRCIARSRVAHPLFRSPLPMRRLTASPELTAWQPEPGRAPGAFSG